MLFRGLSEINLDAKGRMAMPARYREPLKDHCGGEMVVTLEPYEGASLVVYPLPEFETLHEKVEALSDFNKETKKLKRLFLGHATDVEMDGSGRILIPPPLRKCVGLQKQVVLLGQGKKLELWDEAQWNSLKETLLNEDGLNQDQLPDELKSLSL